MDLEIRGKRALVTGSTSGIGTGIALRLAVKRFGRSPRANVQLTERHWPPSTR